MKNYASRIGIAFLLFLAVGILAGCNTTAKNNTRMSNTTSNTNTNSSYDYTDDKKLTLFLDMRKLWSDHVFWTREYIEAALAGTPDADAAAARLMKNQEDIGAAVATYYGDDAGDKLTALLKEHINIAVDIVAAAKAGDETKLDDANTRWEANAEEIATFLSQANPNWPKNTISEAMKKHLSTTADELKARQDKDYDEDVAAFDTVFEHILHMSDTLSAGIIKQFPDKF